MYSHERCTYNIHSNLAGPRYDASLTGNVRQVNMKPVGGLVVIAVAGESGTKNANVREISQWWLQTRNGQMQELGRARS